MSTATGAVIRFACPSCGKSIKVSAESAGRSGHCPQCGGSFTVPVPEHPDEAVRTLNAKPAPAVGATPAVPPALTTPAPYGISSTPPSAPSMPFSLKRLLLQVVGLLLVLFIASRISPALTLMMGLIGVAFGIAYLAVPQVKAFLAGAFDPATTKRFALIAIPISAMAIYFAWGAFQARSAADVRAVADAKALDELVARANAEFDARNYETAVELANDARLGMGFKDPRRPDMDSIVERSEKQLALALEPGLQSALAEGAKLRAAGDLSSAIARLESATGVRFAFRAPSYAKATSSLKQYREEKTEKEQAEALAAKRAGEAADAERAARAEAIATSNRKLMAAIETAAVLIKSNRFSEAKDMMEAAVKEAHPDAEARVRAEAALVILRDWHKKAVEAADRVNQANYAKIEKGWPAARVEQLLGTPTMEVDKEGARNVAQSVSLFQALDPEDTSQVVTISITFTNGVVTDKAIVRLPYR